jgi:hypothetical protein
VQIRAGKDRATGEDDEEEDEEEKEKAQLRA